MLGSTLDQSNSFNAMLMAGSGNLPSSYYNFGPQPPPTTGNTGNTGSAGMHQTHPTLDGLGSTLAPSALETQYSAVQNQASSFFNDAYQPVKAEAATPLGTPGEADFFFFDTYVQDWDNMPSSQSSQLKSEIKAEGS